MIDRDDAADILAACATHIPVNVCAHQAIAAHKIAHCTSQRDPEARQLAFCVLRVILLARTPHVEDMRAQLEYLTRLPDTAWPDSAEHSAREYREATLAAIRRSIAWRTACA